jgi:hypothetical protein
MGHDSGNEELTEAAQSFPLRLAVTLRGLIGEAQS